MGDLVEIQVLQFLEIAALTENEDVENVERVAAVDGGAVVVVVVMMWALMGG